jgi:hypothetical protein
MFKEITIVVGVILVVWLIIALVLGKFKSPKEKVKLSKRGATAIRGSKWGLGSDATWPFGSIKLYENSIKVSTIYSFRILKYNDVKSVGIEGSRLVINLKKSSEYVAFVSWGDNQEIIEFLKKKKVKII